MNQPARPADGYTAVPEAEPNRRVQADQQVRPDQQGQPGEPRHLRLVDRGERTAAQRRRRARVLLAGGVASVLGVMFGLVFLHVVLAQRQIELDRMSTEAAGQQTRYQALRLQVAQLESPQQIISTAEGRLGMRQPAQVTYVSPPAPVVMPGGGLPPGIATTSPVSSAPGTTAAPAGDADWPRIKAELAGRP